MPHAAVSSLSGRQAQHSEAEAPTPSASTRSHMQKARQACYDMRHKTNRYTRTDFKDIFRQPTLEEHMHRDKQTESSMQQSTEIGVLLSFGEVGRK